MVTLIAMLTVASAHRFDPAVLTLHQVDESTFHASWDAPDGDPRRPVLPCDGGAPLRCPDGLGPVGVEGPGELLVHVRWSDGSATTHAAREGMPVRPAPPARAAHSAAVVAPVAVSWAAPARLVPLVLGVCVGAALVGPVSWAGVWAAVAVVLAARDAVLAPSASRGGFAAAVGMAVGMAAPPVALGLALVAAAALHRVPGLPWLLGPAGVFLVGLEVLG